MNPKTNILCHVTTMFAMLSLHAAEPILKVGDPAPPLQVGEWIQGKPVRSIEPGTTYLIDFWATWCSPCLAYIPHLNARHLKFKDKGLVIIGVAVSKADQDKVGPLCKKMGDRMTYRVVLDDYGTSTQGAMVDSWCEPAGIKSIPAAILIGRDGKVWWIGDPRRLTDSSLEAALAPTYTLANAIADAQKQESSDHAVKQVAKKIEQYIAERKWDEADRMLAEFSRTPDAFGLDVQVYRAMLFVMKGDFDGLDAFLAREKLSIETLQTIDEQILAPGIREGGSASSRFLSARHQVGLMVVKQNQTNAAPISEKP